MYTFGSILERLKGRLKQESSKIEGTFTMDNLQALAQELAMIHNTEIEPIKDAVFLDTACGADLDRRALDYNETRHPAKASTGRLQFKGSARTFVPAGTAARLDTLLFETTEPARIDAAGLGTAAAVCQKTGTVGNVPAWVVNTMVRRIEGVQEVTNPVPFEGGTEAEDDEAFRTRLFEKIRFPITSGNEYYYEYLAKQVPGIWRAKCKGTWNGPGTVKLTLLGPNATTPDSTVIDNVRQHVEAQRLIGADITYMGAVPLPISITGNLVLAPGYIVEDITPAIRAEFTAYLEEIAFDRTTGYLSYHKAIEMVFRVPGIQDITELLINGATSSVDIGHDEFCQLQEVVFSAD